MKSTKKRNIKILFTTIWLTAVVLALFTAGTVMADSGEYENATITCNGESMEAVKVNDRYYAYNPEMNIYVFSKSTNIIEEFEPYISESGAVLDWNAVYSSGSSDWSSGENELVFEALKAFYDVATWYRDTLGYQGIDGKGGGGIIATNIKESKLGSPALNIAELEGYVILTAPSVTSSAEVLAHEYGHSLLKHTCGLKGTNESSALNEAICDLFASVYAPEKGWVIGPEKCWRNIPEGTLYSKKKDKILNAPLHMSDYEMDYSDEYAGQIDELNTWQNATSGLNGIKYKLSTSTNHRTQNSFILSHAMYRMWNDLFQNDDSYFVQLIYTACKYLPADAGFSNFRDAFLAVLDADGNAQSFVAQCSTYFDVAGIRSAGPKSVESLKERIRSDFVNSEATAVVEETVNEPEQVMEDPIFPSPSQDTGMVLPSNAGDWSAFFTDWFGQYTGSAMDAESLADIHIAFADMTGDGVEELIVARPDTSAMSVGITWWLEVYQEDEYGVFFTIYTDMAMNNHGAAKRFDLLKDENGIGYLLVEKHVVGTGVGDEEIFDHISMIGGQTEWYEGRGDLGVRTDETLMLRVWDDDSVYTGGHTIPEYFPELF